MVREKIAAFIEAHGYTYKSFFLSIVVFPPAAAFIAYKKPNIGIAQRVVLGIFGLFFMPVFVTYVLGRLAGLLGLHT